MELKWRISDQLIFSDVSFTEINKSCGERKINIILFYAKKKEIKYKTNKNLIGN